MSTTDTVLIAYTPDDFGQAALAHGIAEATRRSARIVAVNATRGDAYVDERHADDDRVATLEEELTASGLEFVVRRPIAADVAEAVVEAADEESADVIVIGLRRRSPVGKLVMGSVAQRVLLGAGCPVLAVKP